MCIVSSYTVLLNIECAIIFTPAALSKTCTGDEIEARDLKDIPRFVPYCCRGGWLILNLTFKFFAHYCSISVDGPFGTSSSVSKC